ncbi:DUF4344 domain-containing protein [Mycobacterium sp. smrl_JER01]
MIFRYDDAASPEAVSGKRIYQDHQMLEDMADGINYLFDLPYDIPVVGLQCDESNAYWNRTDQQMELCYEFVDDLQSLFGAAGEPDPLAMAMDATYATFFHEMGHMVIDIYDLPITGREEDVADQVAAFMLLQPGEDEQLDGESVDVMLAMAELFELFAAEDGEPDESAFADEHSPDKVRVYNLLCWTFGADPDGNSGIVDNGLLPEERAVQCEDEFEQINRSWITLLAPHMKD